MKSKLIINRRGIRFSVIRSPNVQTGGISSRTMDHMHIPFFDYDKVALDVVREELEILQERHRLTPFYLFRSSDIREMIPPSNSPSKEPVLFGNWHALSLSKRFMKQVFNIQQESSCDNGYSGMIYSTIYRSWVLRAFPKLSEGLEVRERPVFQELVCFKGYPLDLYKQQISQAHEQYLKDNYRIPRLPYMNRDGFNYIWETDYETRKG